MVDSGRLYGAMTHKTDRLKKKIYYHSVDIILVNQILLNSTHTISSSGYPTYRDPPRLSIDAPLTLCTQGFTQYITAKIFLTNSPLMMQSYPILY